MRSKLFVPASRPEFFTKAFNTAADGISFDLEDAVKPVMRTKARHVLADFLDNILPPENKTIIVRINPLSSDDGVADLHAVVLSAVAMINLPKVENAAQIQMLDEKLTLLEKQRHIKKPLSILATIETAKGLRMAQEIAAASPRMAGLQLGFADLLEPLTISSANQQIRQQIRLMIRLAAAEQHLPVWDSAWTDIQNKNGFHEDACLAKEAGFIGKSCIHPSQIDLANTIFMPTQHEIQYAQQILAQAKLSQQGATTLHGKMIDAPYIQRAIDLLTAAEYYHKKDKAP